METKKAIRSKTIWGNLTTLTSALFIIAEVVSDGVVAPGEIELLMGAVLGVAGSGYAIYGRFKASQPVTL